MNSSKIKAYSGKDPYIFVSYAHKDSDLILPIISSLQRKYNVWFDEGLHYGREWDEEIIDKLKNCSMFIFMVTNTSLNSKNCKDELIYARDNGKDFINICVEQDTKMNDWFQFRFGGFHMCNLYTFNTYDEAIDDLSQKCDFLEKVRISKNNKENISKGENTIKNNIKQIDDSIEGKCLPKNNVEKTTQNKILEINFECNETFPKKTYVTEKDKKCAEQMLILSQLKLASIHGDIHELRKNGSVKHSKLELQSKSIELLKCYIEAYKLKCELFGEDNLESISCLKDIVSIYIECGCWEKALEINDKIYKLQCTTLGEQHPDTQLTLKKRQELLRLCDVKENIATDNNTKNQKALLNSEDLVDAKSCEENKKGVSKKIPINVFRDFLAAGRIDDAIDYALNYEGYKYYKCKLIASLGYVFANCFWESGPLHGLYSTIKNACEPYYNLEKALYLWVDAINKNSEESDKEIFKIALRPLLEYYIKATCSDELSSSIVSCIVETIKNKIGFEIIENTFKKELVEFIQHLLKNNKELDAKNILMFWRLEGDPDAAYFEAALLLKKQDKRDKDLYLRALEIISCSKDSEHIPCIMLKAICYLNLYAVTKEYKYRLTASDLLKKASDYGETCAMLWIVNDSLKYCDNSEQLIKTLKKLVFLEYKGAKEALAICYLEGLSCSKDIVEAESLLFNGNTVDSYTVFEEIEELGGNISYSDIDILAKVYYIAKEGTLIEKNKAKRVLKKICLDYEESLPQNIMEYIRKTILNIRVKPYKYEMFDCEIEVN